MTDEERYVIEGRTRDALRTAKRNIASLRIGIEEHAEHLKEASEQLIGFLAEPVGNGPTGMSRIDYVLHFYRDAVSDEIEAKMRQLAHESEKAADLEAKIQQFN